jgi:uncharacterized protein (DUF2141 family)
MRKFALILGLVFTGLFATAQENDGVTITVTVENVLSDGGTILGGLHTADTFMKGQGVASAIVPAKEGEVTLTFENVQPGTFAVMVMHDKNDNMRMDMEANGMPKESYGMTGPMDSYGPPTFEAAKFEVANEDLDFRIRF